MTESEVPLLVEVPLRSEVASQYELILSSEAYQQFPACSEQLKPGRYTSIIADVSWAGLANTQMSCCARCLM